MSSDILRIAGAGMRAQNDRLRVIASNIANADSTATAAGGNPYRRQIAVFQNVLDRETGLMMVKVTQRANDKSDFNTKFMPGHPAANEEGYVTTTNVNPVVEMVDMREARRAYEANAGVVEAARSMSQRLLDLLR